MLNLMGLMIFFLGDEDRSSSDMRRRQICFLENEKYELVY